MIWWNLPVPPKIRIFMWLVSHNTILTKDNLAIKGWVGDPKCQFCLHNESIDHLFITCTLAQQIWFWLGKTQLIMQSWTTWDSILAFAYSLDVIDRTGFLIILSAVSWRNMSKKVKNAVGEWIPIIEDVIHLNQYMPLELVPLLSDVEVFSQQGFAAANVLP
ncbi:uncharacterized protein LOC144568710 [Carex rostrata]